MKILPAAIRCSAGAPVFALTSPRPPLGGFTKEMQAPLSRQPPACMLPQSASRRPAPHTPPDRTSRCCGSKESDRFAKKVNPPGFSQRVLGRFLRSHPRRIGLGYRSGRDPAAGNLTVSWVFSTSIQNRNFLLCWKAELSTLP